MTMLMSIVGMAGSQICVLYPACIARVNGIIMLVDLDTINNMLGILFVCNYTS
jgi:hypothetical protein